MGCFLTNGFISHLPITCDDPIYGILCIKEHKNLTYEFITPVFLPIKGTYNDYGRIHNIEYTPEVKLLEELAGFPIDRIIDLVYKGYSSKEYDDSEIHDEKDRKDYDTLCKNLKVTKNDFGFFPY